MAAKWKSYQIASAGDIATLADTAKSLADTVKSTLTLANVGMEAVKLLAQLQTINPLLIALDALAEEILKEIANLKEAGYYYLYVDPFSPEKNVALHQSHVKPFSFLKENIAPTFENITVI